MTTLEGFLNSSCQGGKKKDEKQGVGSNLEGMVEGVKGEEEGREKY